MSYLAKQMKILGTPLEMTVTVRVVGLREADHASLGEAEVVEVELLALAPRRSIAFSVYASSEQAPRLGTEFELHLSEVLR